MKNKFLHQQFSNILSLIIKSKIMKRLFVSLDKATIFRMLFCVILMSIGSIGCNKTDHIFLIGNTDASRYSSDVIDKWITMQIRLERDATGIPNVAFVRYYAYSGIAALEALAPGKSLDKSFNMKWNGLTDLPQPENFKRYYWPASVNTALASMNRNIFTHANAVDSAAIDSLENALNTSFLTAENKEVIERSNSFGKDVAAAVFSWSETDGYKNSSAAYTPPVGEGLWVPTPPAYAPASTPYWGNNRPIVAGSIDNTQPGPPIPYSEDPQSPFYQMVKQVYDVSLTLTPDQTAWALFWRDIPGVTIGGHWVSILQQVLKQTNSHLDKAAFAYALTGVCLNDASISCWQTKYKYNQVRPITYIRAVMGYSTWNSLLTTPAHPEYSSAHAVVSSAISEGFAEVFGDIGSFTDHTYDYEGFAPRTFSSFRAIGEDAGNSRLYAGIHYQPSIDTGLIQGRKVAANIFRELTSGSTDGKSNW
ncbi:MAG TPA: vanadium-dependent haloperoxidase [Puia sp.]|nr:vanadium-dependent haloperoxidase [Puia sp.]